MPREKILILTQNLEIVHQLDKTVLAPAGFEVLISTTVEEALSLITDNVFKAGIVGLSTQPLLNFLSELAEKQLRLPIILLCGREQKAVPLEILSYKIKGYLRYPLDPAEVHTVLTNIVETVWTENEQKQLANELTTLNSALEQRIKEASVLQGIGRSVNNSLDLDAVLNRLVEAATFITKAEEGYLLLLEEETGELFMRAAKNMGERRAHVTRLKVNDSIAGTVVQSGKPIILSGGSNKRFKVKTGYVVHALLNVPIKVGDRVIGVLGVDNPASNTTFTLDDLRRLSALADNAVGTIKNARVYTQISQHLTQHIKELEVLQSLIRDLSATTDRELIAQLILTQAIKVTDAEVGVIGWLGQDEPMWISQGTLAHHLVNGNGDQKDKLWWDQPELKTILSNGKSILVSQKETATHTATTEPPLLSRLSVPLKRGNTVLGLIDLESSKPDAFDNDDLWFVQTIAGQAALALHGSAMLETIDLQQAQISLLIQNTSDGIWIVNSELQILELNQAACHLLGCQIRDVIGNHGSTIWPEQTGGGHRELSRYLEQSMAVADRVSFSQGVTLTLENGQILLVEGQAIPLFNQGRVIGAIAFFQRVSPDRDVERLQADFISMASHNLRTPLMHIQTCLDYVLETGSDIEASRDRLQAARIQSQKIASFLQELLEVSQLSQGKETPLNIQPVNFLPLLQTVVADFEAATTDIEFIVENPPVLPLVSADAAKVEIILRNLLAHGRRRSVSGDRLTIKVVEQEEQITISISDNGPNIPANQQQQIFWQIYPLEADKQNGAMPYSYGIGLFTTRRLVELLGGSIWLSAPRSHGVQLNFTLPIWR